VLRAFGMTDKGGVRATNEDFFAIDESLRLCVVADGMGGHNAGEVAARLAVDTMVDYIRESRHRGAESSTDTWPFGFDPELSAAGNLLKTAIHLANLQILRMAGTAEEYSGMGTTVVATLLAGDRLSVGHVGDSRLYLIAGGRIRQLTHDDSWMATVLTEKPDTDPALLQHHPMRNALTNVVGARPRLEAHVAEETLSGGERLLLSTDGVHGVLDQSRLQRIVLDGAELAQVPGELVSAALAGGSRDNCTVVVAEYVRDEADAVTSPAPL
jgi:serine/threonine protein phosphatase PrpC